MNHSIHLRPDELAGLVVKAATNAENEGYWTGTGPISEDAARHLTTFLGLLLGGDDHVDEKELKVFEQVWTAATGGNPDEDELRTSVTRSVNLADDPDALQEYLTATPPYMQAVIAMDRDRGTRNAEQVVTALSGLALAVLAADGKAAAEEDSVFTTHLNHLRNELAKDGLVGKD
ncbi:MAG TPA: hypothetical protein VFS20_03630 [Longimicrobium sp.]|nr:hypothetical protein [Longimicrobium sp.]